ncbi:MAG TPA: heme exporter protein CcmD [Luteimonas sp.]|nr:heme exporter protein CcmD [Luteimonas sp.]
MSYAGYVAAAYGVFVVVLLWDFVATRVRLRRLLHAATLAGTRRAAPAPTTELSR